jgi:hypothetical protein
MMLNTGFLKLWASCHGVPVPTLDNGSLAQLLPAVQSCAGFAARGPHCLLPCLQVSCRLYRAMQRPGRRMRPRTRGCLRCRPGACSRPGAQGSECMRRTPPCPCDRLADISSRKAVLSLA